MTGFLRFIIIIFLLCIPVKTFGQNTNNAVEPEFIIEAKRLLPGETITIDGKLDEPLWQRMTPIRNFRQQYPVEGAEPTEQTEIYVAYDDNYLYIGAVFFDSNPSGIIAYQKRRNQGIGTDDRFMWILDTFNSGRNAYFFEINPAGLKGDGLISVGQGVSVSKSWDGIWFAEVHRDSHGWSAEIKIPFRTLDFDPNQSGWGINFQRTVRRKNEEILWAGWRRNQGVFRPQNSGLLTGFRGMNQGIGLEVKPYVTATPTRRWLNGSATNSFDYDAGFDISYSVTPGVRTSLTVNTDFAEAEVDQRRVNLTRFPLVFPEQRDFFLEGSSVFNFAPASGITPFFSRRIGLIGGEAVPIHFGARAIGRTSTANFGFYQIRTGNDTFDTEDFTVVRYSHNIFEESSIGVIYTRRATLGNDFFPVRHTMGYDLELNTSRFLGDKNLQFQAFFVWHNPDNALDESAFWDRTSRGIRLSFPNYPFFGHLSYREIGEAFNPAVGIATRVGFRRLQPTIGYTRVLEENTTIRSVSFELSHTYLTDIDFKPESVSTTLRPINIFFESGEQVWVNITRNYERLMFPFDILRDDSIIIPAGDYYSWALNMNVSSAGFRRVVAAFSYTYEGFWTGTRNGYSTSLTLRPYPGINLSGSWSRSVVDLAEGDFTTDLLRFQSNLDLTTTYSFTNITQYDTVSELLGFYNRIRWILTPGSDLFLVYTWNWLREEDRFRPLETQGSVKLSYTYRF